jgi:hypoxanthine phosphoribosyltransferase
VATVRSLFSAAAIAARLDAMAAEIAAAMPTEIVVVAVLKGSFMFAADLVRALNRVGVATTVDFMRVSSYGANTRSSGDVRIRFDFEVALAGRAVLIVDDILDTGRTLAFVRELLSDRGATVVKTCCLLDKPSRRETPIAADFVGFDCPNLFVVGYGLDFGDRYRELPYVGVLEG